MTSRYKARLKRKASFWNKILYTLKLKEVTI